MVVRVQNQDLGVIGGSENDDSLRVTPMLIDHLPRVLELEAAAYDFPWSHGVFVDCLRAGYSCHLLWSGDQLLGYSLVAIAAGEAHLLNICVDPTEHRRGHASGFLNVILGVAADRGADTVYLEVRPSNQGALGLYRKFGFSRIGVRKNYYRALKGREDAIVLSRDIRHWPGC